MLWLAGRGFGWFGDGGAGQSGLARGDAAADRATTNADEVTRVVAPDTRPAPAATGPTAVVATERASERTNERPGDSAPASPAAGEVLAADAPPAERDPPAAPAGESSPPGSAAGESRGTAPTPAATDRAAAAPPVLDADRFASLLSLVDLRLYEQAPVRALTVLAEIDRLGPSPAQAAELAGRRQQAEQGLAGVLDALQDELRAGDVFAARPRVEELLSAGAAGAAALAVLPPPVWRAGTVAAGLDLRQPEPLAKGRAVWFRMAGTRRLAHVVDGRSDRATLRVASGGGATFPTVAPTEVCPVDPQPEEAVSMAWAALRAGDLVLARCWFGVLQLRASSIDGPELAALAAAVR